jgi:hypothetical protein
MKAEAVCPQCKEKVIETCEVCIKTGILTHLHDYKTGDVDFYQVGWKIVEE